LVIFILLFSFLFYQSIKMLKYASLSTLLSLATQRDCGGDYSVLSEARSRVKRYLNWGGWQRRWGSYDVPQSDVALHSVPMEPEKKALASSASTPAKE
jgi:hypothetical protein